MLGTLDTMHQLAAMLKPWQFALEWWSVISFRAHRAWHILGKMRSQPACLASSPLTAVIDRVAQETSRATCKAEESGHLGLYSVRGACIR